MTVTVTTTRTATSRITTARGAIFTPTILRGGLLALIAAAFIASVLATGAEATNVAIAHDGTSLTRLMRFMAAIKGVIAIAASATVLWRLRAAITFPWCAAYAGACASMAAGPGLIWSMAHVGLGALLLHGGLFATIMLLWFDPAVSSRLGEIVAARRLQIATRPE